MLFFTLSALGYPGFCIELFLAPIGWGSLGFSTGNTELKYIKLMYFYIHDVSSPNILISDFVPLFHQFHFLDIYLLNMECNVNYTVDTRFGGEYCR